MTKILRSNITKFIHRHCVYYRAHIWTRRGYSSITCATLGEAIDLIEGWNR